MTSTATPNLLVGWVPDVGIGNQMLAIASYLLLGIAMDRSVALYWMPGMMHDYKRVASAFSVDATLLPDFLSVALGLPQTVDSKDSLSDKVADNPGSTAWSPDDVRAHSRVFSFGERARKIDFELSRTLLLGDLERTFSSTDVVHIATNQPLWRFLERNPLYAGPLQQLFETDIYGNLLRHFLEPAQPVVEQSLQFLQQQPLLQHIIANQDPTNDTKLQQLSNVQPPVLYGADKKQPLVIGVHIRFGMDMTNDHYDPYADDQQQLEDFVDGIITSTKLAITRRLAAASVGDLKSDGVLTNLRSVVVYLAADNPKVKVCRRATSECVCVCGTSI